MNIARSILISVQFSRQKNTIWKPFCDHYKLHNPLSGDI